MANVTVQRALRRGIDLMFGVIKIRLRHPAIDKNRFRDRGCSVRRRHFHFVTKGASDKISARGCAHALLRFVRIFSEENRTL